MSFSRIASDPRVDRQIRALNADYRLIVAGHGPAVDGCEHYIGLPDKRRGFARKILAAWQLLRQHYLAFYRGTPKIRAARDRLAPLAFDAILANDIDALPLAVELAGTRPVVFDAHEYAPLEFEDKLLWRLLSMRSKRYLCRRFLPQATTAMTVCEGIARKYESEFGLNMHVVPNACAYQDLAPSAVGDVVRLIHHGGAMPSRRIEVMIQAMDHVDERFTLDLMLVKCGDRYYRKLQSLAAERKNVRLIEPVDMREVCSFSSSYDVGIFQLPPTNFNYAMALPNKFFEFVQARLAIVIGPSPEMQRLLERYDLGIVADDFTAASLARAINALSPESVRRFKANADTAARELSFEVQSGALLDCIASALDDQRQGPLRSGRTPEP